MNRHFYAQMACAQEKLYNLTGAQIHRNSANIYRKLWSCSIRYEQAAA